jgi:hypothetical protein
MQRERANRSLAQTGLEVLELASVMTASTPWEVLRERSRPRGSSVPVVQTAELPRALVMASTSKMSLANE